MDEDASPASLESIVNEIIIIEPQPQPASSEPQPQPEELGSATVNPFIAMKDWRSFKCNLRLVALIVIVVLAVLEERQTLLNSAQGLRRHLTSIIPLIAQSIAAYSCRNFILN